MASLESTPRVHNTIPSWCLHYSPDDAIAIATHHHYHAAAVLLNTETAYQQASRAYSASLRILAELSYFFQVTAQSDQVPRLRASVEATCAFLSLARLVLF